MTRPLRYFRKDPPNRAYRKGMLSFANGAPRQAVPVTYNAVQAEQWRLGWNRAFLTSRNPQ